MSIKVRRVGKSTITGVVREQNDNIPGLEITYWKDDYVMIRDVSANQNIILSLDEWEECVKWINEHK